MARKASADSESSHGFNDIIGAVLMCFAALLLVALLSYQPRDVSANVVPTNPSVHNWIGPFGAGMAYYCLLCVGAAAYFLPVLLFFLGLGYFLEGFAYLRRRWVWLVVFMVCGMGLLDLYKDLLRGVSQNLHIPIGGILGVNLNQYFFGYFGTVGATLIFLTLYFISLLFLTNFQLGEWMRRIWTRSPDEPQPSAPNEQALEHRARDLHQQAKKLQEEAARTGLGADLKPVPEPTVRDLSVPQARPSRPKKAQPEPGKEPAPADEGEVIPAREVAAATTAEVLGKPAEDAKAEEKPEAPQPRRSRSPRPKSPGKSPSLPLPSSAITSCRRLISCGSRIPRSSPPNRRRN